ncbi:RnfH family protein [Porticoccaceae bacterium]|jgi:putative ubiquitin-RnfH superfamily antitoxin RatB of RatAB toxin-antitoxin module|nr:RnfH family protein [Porticoccaceae bacterium]
MVADIGVEVVYALPERQVVITLRVCQGSTAREVIVQSGILNDFPAIDLDSSSIGVFSQILGAGGIESASVYRVREFDRLEIYRPLIADPKEVRRRRAKATQTTQS